MCETSDLTIITAYHFEKAINFFPPFLFVFLFTTLSHVINASSSIMTSKIVLVYGGCGALGSEAGVI
jgi:hypothetical protein